MRTVYASCLFLSLTAVTYRIPSVNPDQVSDPMDPVANEERLAKALAAHFEALGADVTLQMVAPHRPNVYAVWRSADPSAKWLGVDVHMDTVAVEVRMRIGLFVRMRECALWKLWSACVYAFNVSAVCARQNPLARVPSLADSRHLMRRPPPV